MSYSTTMYKLVDIIMASARRCNMIKAIIRAVCVALGRLIMTSITKQFTAPQMHRVETRGPEIKKVKQTN